jgi:hypothetical protein
MPTDATFFIRETTESGHILFELWRRSCDSYGECWDSLLAEASTRTDARALLQHYAALERHRFQPTEGVGE